MRFSAAAVMAGSALLLLAGCAESHSAAAGGAIKVAGTAKAVIETMRTLELKADFKEYGRCFSEKGKGWLLGELCQGLLWEAYEEDHDQTMGTDAEDMLEKYGLTHLAGELSQWATEEGRTRAWERLAKMVGARWGEFLRDYRNLHPVMIFPANLRIMTRRELAGKVVLKLVDPRGLCADITVDFVRQGGRWVCDGGESGE